MLSSLHCVWSTKACVISSRTHLGQIADGVILFANDENKVHLRTVYGRYWALSDNGSGGFPKEMTSD